MKLYRVTIEYEVLVAGEDEDDAWNRARDSVSDIQSFEDFPDIHVGSEVKSADDIPKDWRGCIPYGDDTRDKRTEQYFG